MTDKELLIRNYQLKVLSREIAEKYVEKLAELADQIPLVDYTQEEILSEGKLGRPFYGKWERSLVLEDPKTNEPMGFIVGYERDVDGTDKYPFPSIYISELAVSPNYQKKGVGRYLIEKFLKHNTNLGMRQFPEARLIFSIQTNSDLELNSHVINLYKSFGFTPCATKKYDNRTDLVMGLELKK
jgi:ribosomal protein S18 acetylase RimI-like enzyme